MQVMNDYEKAKQLAYRRLEISKEDLLSAIRNYENEDYRTANNRAYYSVFHAISACFALHFKSFKQHSQLIGNFNKDFIHTGIFHIGIAKKIGRLHELRHDSDYCDFFTVSPEETFEQIETAKEFFTLAEKYIKENVDIKN